MRHITLGVPKGCVSDLSAGEGNPVHCRRAAPAPSLLSTQWQRHAAGTSNAWAHLLATPRVGDGGWTDPAPHLHNPTSHISPCLSPAATSPSPPSPAAAATSFPSPQHHNHQHHRLATHRHPPPPHTTVTTHTTTTTTTTLAPTTNTNSKFSTNSALFTLLRLCILPTPEILPPLLPSFCPPPQQPHVPCPTPPPLPSPTTQLPPSCPSRRPQRPSSARSWSLPYFN